MTLRWIDEKIMLQRFPNTLSTLLQSVGWEEFAKYRSKNGEKYAEVRLFQTKGSDKVIRKFGIVNTYDLEKPTFADERFVTIASKLSNIGIGNGKKTVFDFPTEYILPGTEIVQVGDFEVADTEYTIDRRGRTITFKTAPTGIIKASYSLSAKAFEPMNAFGIFLFDSVTFDIDNPITKIGDANGELKTFSLDKTDIKPGSVKVFIDKVEVDEFDYTVQISTGIITFYDAPKKGAISASSISARGFDENNDYGDLLAEATGALNTSDGMGAIAFSAANFKRPSQVTVMTLTNEVNLNASFGRDSLLHVWGSINKDRLALHLRVDAASDPNNIWHVPLYLGRINNCGKKPKQNTVLIGGCRNGANAVWSKDKKVGGHLMDSGPETSNGNNYPLLQQTIGGSYHQQHYLSFITHDKDIERIESGQGPSVYDEKYHDSFMYISHHYDKEVGVLDDIYAVHPSGLEQDAELEIEDTIVHENIGVGDGYTTTFHLYRHTTDEKPLVYIDCVEQTINYDDDYKVVEFITAPTNGAVITASYNVSNTHQYNLSETPITPMALDTTTPYVGIGWGVFKKKH